MEADISILRKTGHFYFALTRRRTDCRGKMRMSGLSKVEMSGFIVSRGPMETARTNENANRVHKDGSRNTSRKRP
jgi:hypothetical protein